MLRLLNAGFGDPLPLSDQQLIAGWGYDGIRSDYGPAVIPALAGGPFSHAIIVMNRLDNLPHVLDIEEGRVDGPELIYELGNELNATMNPREYAAELRRVTVGCVGRATLLTAGINNLSKPAFDWLWQVLDAGIPREIEVAFHSYRDPGRGPDYAHAPFQSRAQEFHALLEVAGDRPVWGTECGWHTAAWSRGTWPCKKTGRNTNEQIKEWLAEEDELTRQWGAQSFTVYQFNDGPTDTELDRYGMRDVHGNEKPQAHWRG